VDPRYRCTMTLTTPAGGGTGVRMHFVLDALG
jgi:hypothetical protein